MLSLKRAPLLCLTSRPLNGDNLKTTEGVRLKSRSNVSICSFYRFILFLSSILSCFSHFPPSKCNYKETLKRDESTFEVGYAKIP